MCYEASDFRKNCKRSVDSKPSGVRVQARGIVDGDVGAELRVARRATFATLSALTGYRSKGFGAYCVGTEVMGSSRCTLDLRRPTARM